MMFSYAKAEEINLDFDGVTKGKEISEVFKNTESIKPTTNPFIVDNKVDDLKEEEIKKINHSILQTVNYCEKNNIHPFIGEGLKKLLAHGTKEEKTKLLLNTEYIISDRLAKLEVPDISILQRELIGKDKWMCDPTCVKWESKEVCRDKEVWQTACIAAGVVCYTVAGSTCGPATAVCTLVNRIVPECVNVPVCVEVQEICAPGF